MYPSPTFAALCSRDHTGAADRQPDSCTKNPEAARRLNVTATENLAQACSQRDAFLIYISTDYVFPGIEGQAPYKATDETRPPNIYGETKRDGEDAVLRVTKGKNNAVVLRVPVLYGNVEPEDNNKESAVNVLLDALWKSQDKQGDERVKMDDWAIRYPTNTSDIGRVCVDVAKYYTSNSGQDLPSILQFSSEDRMTKYEICEKFSEIMGLPMDGLVPDKDGGRPGLDGTVRPYDCHLDTGELKKLGIDVSTVDFVAWWRRQVKAFRR
jgi:S-adenosylmethionine synthetase